MKNRYYHSALLLSLFFLSEGCIADNISQEKNIGIKVFFAGFSSHINGRGDPNESHSLLGLSYDSFEVMRMKNSYRKTSVVLSRNNNIYKKVFCGNNVQLNIRTGISSGYDKAKHNVDGFIPVVQPNIYIEHGSGFGAEFGLIPYSGEQSDGVITLSVSYKF